jgi:hypothetical protein
MFYTWPCVGFGLGHVELPSVGGVRKFGWNPRTQVEEGKLKRSSTQTTQEETKNLLKTAQTSKVVNPFTRALAPPFIGRRRDFYILKIPSNPRNIPSVNMYMNVFYISYIYKPATSSHTKPRLFEMTSLTWLPTDSWISPFRKSSYAVTSELELQQIPELRRFPISWFRRFMTPSLHRFTTSGGPQVQDSRSSQVRDSELRRSEASDLRKSAISELHRFKIPNLHKFATLSFAGLGLRIFAGSPFRSFTGSRFLKTHFTNFVKLDVSRVTGFPEFPNTSPSGKRVDSDDPISRKP